MPFNDLPILWQCFQALPKEELNPTERLVLIHIATPSKGAYMGQDALAAQCGVTVRHSLRVIRKLVALGFVTKDLPFAHKGRAQCYRVDIAAIESYTHSVTPMSPITRKHDATEPKGDATEPKSDTYGSKAGHPRHPYKEYKDNKDDKDARYDFIIENLEDAVKARIKYGNNVRLKLDTLTLLGVPLKAIKAEISGMDFSTANNVGGLFIHRLDDLIDAATVATKSVRAFEPTTCDMCTVKCVFNNSLDEFQNGARCNFTLAAEYEEAKKRNGL